MFNIDLKGKIEISRGDSASTVLSLDEGIKEYMSRYILGEGSTIYLGVFEPNSTFEHSIIKKKFTDKDLNEDGDLLIKFLPKDTICLKPGLYFYQIKLKMRLDVEPDYEEQPESDTITRLKSLMELLDEIKSRIDLNEDDIQTRIDEHVESLEEELIKEEEKQAYINGWIDDSDRYEINTVVETTQFRII